ncbi:LPS translocon maturation chaperone LptM [Spiribacter pallidus]
MLKTLALIALVVCLAGCGVKGDLYPPPAGEPAAEATP